MSLKDQLKKEISIIIFLKYFNLLPFNHHPNHRFPCPIHQGENTTACRYNPTQNNFYCYVCCKPYDVFSTYSELTNETNFTVIINKLQQLLKNETFQQFIQKHNQIQQFSTFTHYSTNKKIIDYDEPQIKQIKKQLFKTTSPLFNQIRDFYHQKLISNYNNESQIGLDYLINKRKLKLETIKAFKLGFAPFNDKPFSFQLTNYLKNHQSFNETDLLKYGLIKQRHRKDNQTIYFHDTFYGSIIIPIENGNNKTFHFYENHFRQTEFKQPKYKSLPNFSNTPTFFFNYRFFEALPFIKATKKVYIVEGFFDVIQSFNHGIKNVIGTITIANKMSESQIAILKQHNIKAIIIPDNDNTGYKKANLIYNQLKEAKVLCQIQPIKEPYNKTCKDVDDLLKQFGTTAFYDSFN